MGSKTILFKRTPSAYFNPKRELRYVIIYDDGIESAFYALGKEKSIFGVPRKIEYISKYDIAKIYSYYVRILGILKYPTGFQVQTKNNKICIIGTGGTKKRYLTIYNALKKCIGDKWDEVYNERILTDKEAGHWQ